MWLSQDVRVWCIRTSDYDVLSRSRGLRRMWLSQDVRIWCIQTSDYDVLCRSRGLRLMWLSQDVRIWCIQTSDYDVLCRSRGLRLMWLSQDVRVWCIRTSDYDVLCRSRGLRLMRLSLPTAIQEDNGSGIYVSLLPGISVLMWSAGYGKHNPYFVGLSWSGWMLVVMVRALHSMVHGTRHIPVTPSARLVIHRAVYTTT